MTGHDMLREALQKSFEKEISEYRVKSEKDRKQFFSDEFEKGMNMLISDYKTNCLCEEPGKYLPSNMVEINRYRTVKIFGHRMRRAIVIAIAALLILAMTATAIAIMKPAIFYEIIERLNFWEINPVQEEVSNDMVKLIPVMPDVPEKYKVVNEDIDEVGYTLEFEDDDGHTISYYQFLPDGAKVYLDKGKEAHREVINGREAIVTDYGDYYSIIIDNGISVMEISGTCTYDELYHIAYNLAEYN